MTLTRDAAAWQGVRVLSVEVDGQCAKAGISAGDLILSVNDTLCLDHAQAIGLLKTQAESVKVVFQDKYSR